MTPKAKKRKRLTLYSFIALPFLLAFAFQQLPEIENAKWKISWNKELLKGKKDFLRQNPTPKRVAPPNILLIVCDDLGKKEVSTYGYSPLQTPNIDSLGSSGVVFEQGYVTSPICGPSRAGLMTGRTQNRFGYETQIVDFYPKNWIEYLGAKHLIDMESWELTSAPDYPSESERMKQGVPPSEINLAEFLKAHGYDTAAFGKWHMGNSYWHKPNNRGFDQHYGFYGAFSLYTAEEEWPGIVNYRHDQFGIEYQWNKGRSDLGAIRENDTEVREEGYLTQVIRDKAIDFLEDRTVTDAPFFLYLPFSAPHIPYQAPEEYHNKFNHISDPNKRVYYAMIAALDDAVGSIMQTLEQQGLRENTLVVFISDNGGADYAGATDNAPLKGGKTTQFEGGIMVPFMMSWPSEIGAGKRFKYPVISTDIFTTVAAAIGADLPSDRTYDGVDLLPFINRKKMNRPHQTLYWRAGHIWAIRDGDYKLILSTRDKWAELYNLKNDRSEQFDLIHQFPDIYESLRDKHETWQMNFLPERPMWPGLVDMTVTIEGKHYKFAS